MTEKLIRNEQEAIECLKKNKPTSGYYMLQESVDIAIQALEEVRQYRAIGTVEELETLKEKTEPKKPIRNDLCTCPACGTHNEVIKKRRNTVVRDTVCCWHCGQALEVKRLE